MPGAAYSAAQFIVHIIFLLWQHTNCNTYIYYSIHSFCFIFHTRLLICKQVNSKTELRYCMLGDDVQRMLVTHISWIISHIVTAGTWRNQALWAKLVLSCRCFIADSFLRGTFSPNCSIILQFYGLRKAALKTKMRMFSLLRLLTTLFTARAAVSAIGVNSACLARVLVVSLWLYSLRNE